MRAGSGTEGDASGRFRLWGALLLELVVVFVGVTAAFLLDAYRQERSDVRRRAQIVDALVNEIQTVSDGARGELPSIEAFSEDFEERLAAGERPALVPLFPTNGFRGDMWEATLQMGGVELLDVDVAMRLSHFYGVVQTLTLEQERLDQFTREILIPNVGRSPDEFYDSSGALRAKYAWYPRGVRELERAGSALVAGGDSLIAILRPYRSSPTQREVLDPADSAL